MNDTEREDIAAMADAIKTSLSSQMGEWRHYVKAVNYRTLAQAAHDARRNVHMRRRHGVPDERTDRAVLDLADVIAQRRTGGHVYMDGRHNPLPTEKIDARRYVEDLIEHGWRPNGAELEALVQDALDIVSNRDVSAVKTDVFIAAARVELGYDDE